MSSDDNNHQKNDETVKNAELREYSKSLDKLNRWTIPSVPSNTIYNIGLFDMRARFAVKTLEQTIRMTNKTQTIIC